MFPLLGDNHHLLLLHMAKRFIWIEETGERINKFEIGYIINISLYVNKTFRYQMEKCMITKFSALTQIFIKTKSSKTNTSFLSLLFFHETRGVNHRKAFIVLICVIYTII